MGGPTMQREERHGVLVGWGSQDLGSTIKLDLQTFAKSNWEASESPDHTLIFMTRSQAAVLANDLLRISGSTPPPRRRGWLRSLFE